MYITECLGPWSQWCRENSAALVGEGGGLLCVRSAGGWCHPHPARHHHRDTPVLYLLPGIKIKSGNWIFSLSPIYTSKGRYTHTTWCQIEWGIFVPKFQQFLTSSHFRGQIRGPSRWQKITHPLHTIPFRDSFGCPHFEPYNPHSVSHYVVCVYPP